MDATCPGSVPQALRAWLEGRSFEEVLRLAVSLGGDSDTIAAIAGSVAEAEYGIPEEILRQVWLRLDEPLRAVTRRFRDRIGKPLRLD